MLRTTIIVYHIPYKYSSNPVHDVVYSIHNYVIKFVSVSTLSGTPVSSTNKTDHHDVTVLLLKVVLNTINQTNLNQTFTGCFLTCVIDWLLLKAQRTVYQLFSTREQVQQYDIYIHVVQIEKKDQPGQLFMTATGNV